MLKRKSRPFNTPLEWEGLSEAGVANSALLIRMLTIVQSEIYIWVRRGLGTGQRGQSVPIVRRLTMASSTLAGVLLSPTFTIFSTIGFLCFRCRDVNPIDLVFPFRSDSQPRHSIPEAEGEEIFGGTE